MTLDAILQYLHLLAILTVVVFISSEAALCRPEWMNPAVVERLVKVDRVYGIAALAILLTGGLRVWLSPKGADWYLHNWLLHAKIGLFVLVGVMSIAPTLRFLRWRKNLRASGALPTPDEVRRARKLVMVQAHIVAVIPLLAVFLARGFGGK
jgi:putative membrane protein